MRFCPWCGTPVTAAAQFCAGCAASLGPPAEAENAGEEPVPPQPGPFPRMFGRPRYCPGPADHPVGAPDYPAGGHGYPPGPDHPRGPDGPAGRPVTVHPGPADGPVTVVLPGVARSVPPLGRSPYAGSRLLYDPDRPEGRIRRRSPGHRAQIISAGLAVVVLLAGVIAAWAAFGPHPPPVAAGRLAGAKRPGRPGPGHRSPGPARGSPLVSLAPAVIRDPDAAGVRDLLVNYFNAINNQDFQGYASLFTPGRRRLMTATAFASGYQTTIDSMVTLLGVARASGGLLAATISFTSHQSPAVSPDHTGCTRWAITLFLLQQDGALLISTPPADYHAYHVACG